MEDRILKAIEESDPAGAAKELAREALLMGSTHLDRSLGHSVSCTGFILLEMMERQDVDPWPALASLAEYFCAGGFHPSLAHRPPLACIPEGHIPGHLLRAASGQGIVNLHHTITLYAFERVRHWFNQEECGTMLASWVGFMGEKEAKDVMLTPEEAPAPTDYDRFYEMFCEMGATSVAASLLPLASSPQSRRQMGRFLVKAVCDQYQGDYNPHDLTGLGSALWMVEHYGNRPQIVANVLFQYLDFFFEGTRARTWGTGKAGRDRISIPG